MAGKVFLWLASVFLCSLLLSGFFMWRVFGPGPGEYKTVIELNHDPGYEGLRAMEVAMETEYKTTCKIRNETGGCIRWHVGELGSKSVYVELRTRDDTNEITITSFPRYFLYIGPARIIPEHLYIEELLVPALGDNVKSVDRRRYK